MANDPKDTKSTTASAPLHAPADTPEQREARERQARENEKREDERRKVAEKGVDDRLAVKDRQVNEQTERQLKGKPTPTQRENDLAKVGALNIDEKEDDGSGPDDEHQEHPDHGRIP